MRVLLIDDDPRLAELLGAYLRDQGVSLEHAANGSAGLVALQGGAFDAVLLDVMMPGMDGLEVLRRLRERERNRVPVIMLTARGDETDPVVGLELGAEDYITKPFSLRELVARVRTALRRGQIKAVAPHPVVYKGRHLFVDFDAVAINVDEKPVRLTRREFELLKFLVENRNRVLSRDRLLERVWGFDRQIETRSVDVHVGRLRNKLGPAGKQIETVIGLGYRFCENGE